MKINEKLSIFVDSYDGNSDVWENYFKIFNYYWNDCKYPLYLVANEADYKYKNLKVLKVGKNREWFRCTLNALYEIDSKYIMFLLDDHYFSKKMKNEDVEEIISTMEEKQLFFYRLSPCGEVDVEKKRKKVMTSFVYAINLQPAIWERAVFINYLEQLVAMGCKTPWEFERYFIEKFSQSKENKEIEGVMYDTRDLMGYKNAIIQGKWVRHVLNYYNRNTELRLSPGKRPYMSVSSEIFDILKRFSHRFLDYEKRKRIKKIMSKIGIKFMT